MRKATKRMMRIRSGSEFVSVQSRVNPESKYNRCYDNACNETERRAGSELVSGWLVGKFENGMTTIFPHYWNCDERGVHYDTTPFLKFKHSDYEYIWDSAVYEDARVYARGIKKPETLFMPPPLLMHDESAEYPLLLSLNEAGEEHTTWRTIPEISTRVLDWFIMSNFRERRELAAA